MDGTEIRVEALRLSVTARSSHGTAASIVARAKMFENYLLGKQEPEGAADQFDSALTPDA